MCLTVHSLNCRKERCWHSKTFVLSFIYVALEIKKLVIIMVILLSVAPWLLCIWQTREIGATWWVVLITALCVQMSKMLLERVASFDPDGKTTPTMVAGWPELLRAAVGIAVSVYVVQYIIVEMASLGWLSGIVMMLMVLSGIMDYEPPSSSLTYALISTVAFIGVMWGEWGVERGAGGGAANKSFAAYLQFLLSIHALLTGHMFSVEEAKNSFNMQGETMKRVVSLVALVILSSRDRGTVLNHNQTTIMLMMILPAVFLKEKHAITACITPILDQICYPDLYPLRDPQKAEARNLLLVQQKQELMFYIMAWCVVIGLWAHTRPSVLLWVQIAGGITYLASLRRYSNVIRILDFNRKHHYYQTLDKSRSSHHHSKYPTVRRRQPEQNETPQHTDQISMLTKMMALSAAQ